MVSKIYEIYLKVPMKMKFSVKGRDRASIEPQELPLDLRLSTEFVKTN